MNGLGDLFKNKLFLQYLSGAGSAISQGKPVGAALDQVTQQAISAGNYNTLMQKLLAAENPNATSASTPGPSDSGSNKHIEAMLNSLSAGGTVKIHPKGIDISTPMEGITGQQNAEGSQTASVPATTSTAAPVPATQTTSQGQPQQNNASDLINVLSGLSKSDLAGLSPALISSALGGSLATTNAINPPREKPKDTTLIKNYNAAKDQGFKGSIVDFRNAIETTHMKDYKAAVKAGYEGSFNTWLTDMTKAGAINLGDLTKKLETTADVKTEKYFTSPTGLNKDTKKYLSSDDVQFGLAKLTDPTEKKKYISGEAEKYIKSTIAAAGGQIQSARLDGTTFVWSVKWPNGKVSEVRYAN